MTTASHNPKGCNGMKRVRQGARPIRGDSDHAALKPLKIVADPGKGAAGLVVRQLMPHRPFEFVLIQGESDGTVPNGVPNPLHS